MRTNKNTSKIILAIIVALLATMISYSSFNNMQTQLGEKERMLASIQGTNPDTVKDYTYAVATKELKAGEIISDEDIDFSSFETPSFGAFENRSDIVNKVLLQDISKGSIFTDNHIAKISSDELELKEGYRALTLPAERFQGKSNRMAIGSNVDIFSDAGDNSWAMENIKIINLEGENGKPVSDIVAAKSITFEVAADDIADFIANMSKGNIILVARKSGDKRIIAKKRTFSNSSASTGSYPSLPNLPANVPVSDFPATGISGLPQPIQPYSSSPSVELIEANVKSKITFD